MWRLTVLLLLGIWWSKIDAQTPTPHSAYQVGEHITYKAVYNWGFIWVNAGTVDFRVKDTLINNNTLMHFESQGFSLPSYDWFYKVRDYFDSYVPHNSTRPVYFTRNTFEGGYQVNNWFRFNYNDSLIVAKTQNSKQPAQIDTLKMQPDIYDVVSGVYHTRNIPFEKYQVNDKIPLRLIIDGEIFDLYIRYLGKEKLTTRDGRTFRTIKFAAMLVEGTIFKGGEDLFVWVTDDRNKIPVLVEAKILVGSVKALLVETKGLKYPLSAEITK